MLRAASERTHNSNTPKAGHSSNESKGSKCDSGVESCKLYERKTSVSKRVREESMEDDSVRLERRLSHRRTTQRQMSTYHSGKIEQDPWR